MDEMTAYEEMSRLKFEHHLNFTHNPGGGLFYRDDLGEVQIGMQNNVDDLETLKTWLKLVNLLPV